MGSVHKTVDSHSSNLYHLNAIADSSTFVQSVENPEHNVEVCINSALAKAIEEKRHNPFFCRVYFILWTGLALREGGELDIIAKGIS